MLKVFLLISLRSGGEENKIPFCDHSYGSSVTAFSRCLQSCLFFLMWKPFLLSFSKLMYAEKSHTVKVMLEIKHRESNGSSKRYLQCLEISTLVWQFDVGMTMLQFFLNSPENPGIPSQILLVGKTLFPSCEAFFWNTGFAGFLTLFWLGAVRSDLKFHALTFLHVKKKSQFFEICHGKLCNIISLLSEGTAYFQMLYCKT